MEQVHSGIRKQVYWNIPGKLGQYDEQWCHGSLLHQVNSNHVIDYEG